MPNWDAYNSQPAVDLSRRLSREFDPRRDYRWNSTAVNWEDMRRYLLRVRESRQDVLNALSAARQDVGPSDPHTVDNWTAEGGFTSATREDKEMDDEHYSPCPHCEASTHEDNFQWSELQEQDVCPACLGTCDGCGNRESDDSYLYNVEDGIYCETCTSECWNCCDRHRRDTMSVPEGARQPYCSNCCRPCPDCDSVVIRRSRNRCMECELEFDNDDDNYEDEPGEYYGNGIRGYGHTNPSTWFGGPVPKDKSGKNLGYYMGFELEISADRDDGATHVHEWAEEHGMTGIFDCKEDSSVEGYEIATQPMTPEFFESVNWESFFDMLNEHHPVKKIPQRQDTDRVKGQYEPQAHGLHVHIGRIAFERDPVATAAFSYLLSQGKHLERIARRKPYHYCAKVKSPVKVAIVSQKGGSMEPGAQYRRLVYGGNSIYVGRDAINLQNGKTIEIRAFRSTRSADDLRNAVRVVYVAAEYVRHLRKTKTGLNQDNLSWNKFSMWVANQYPFAFESIAGLESLGSNRVTDPRKMW